MTTIRNTEVALQLGHEAKDEDSELLKKRAMDSQKYSEISKSFARSPNLRSVSLQDNVEM